MIHAIRSTRVVTPAGTQAATVVLRDGVIAEVAPYEAALPPACSLDDYGAAVISPGIIDAHVHINEPGRADWEGFETATRAAAAGGITALVDMPLNSSPVTTSVEALQQKIAAAQGKLTTDCGFYGGLVPGNADQIEPLLDAGVLGLKAFMVDSGLDEFPHVSETDLRAAMPILARRSGLLLAHAELAQQTASPTSSSRRYADYLASRPPQMELAAIHLLINLCRETGCRVHIVHLATAEALPLLSAAKAEGLLLTVETAPHYLFFEEAQIPDGATEFKCAPPIRDAANREGLWEGLREGIIDTIGSDHSPCPPSLKSLDTGKFAGAWGGIASLQWGLPIVWTGARARGFAVDDIARWMSSNPARLLGRDGCQGAIATGLDASFVVWEPDTRFTVQPAGNHHRHKVTPYNGVELFGAVQATFLRGQKVYERGTFTNAGTGHPILGRC